MEKKTRMILYVLSLVVLLGMIFLILLFRGKAKNVWTEGESTNSAGEQEYDTESWNIVEEMGQQQKEDSTKQIQDSEAGKSVPEIQDAEEGQSAAEVQQTEEKDSTTLIFAGDVLFENAFQSNYDWGGIESVVEPELLQELLDADIFMVNNEFAFSTRGTPMEGKQDTFRCAPEYVRALKEMGVDIVSLANNHTLDYGETALRDTFATLEEAGILYAGAGETQERAYELQVIEKNGKKFGFLAASSVIPDADWSVEQMTPGLLTAYDDTKLVELIGAVQSACDFLTVYLHWGVEEEIYPQDYQTQIAQDCFAAGADLVLGAHPHCLQGIASIDGKPLFYSLGNFIFGQKIEKTMAVKVEVLNDGSTTCQILPLYGLTGTVKFMEADSATELYRYLESISTDVKIDENGFVIWQ